MSNTPIDERRQFHRVGFHAEAQLVSGELTTQVEILDISLAGALINLDSEPPVMNPVLLQVVLGDDVSFEMHGSLSSYSHGNFALNRDINQLDDDYHLRRLLELNLGEPELIEREVKTLVDKLSWT